MNRTSISEWLDLGGKNEEMKRRKKAKEEKKKRRGENKAD